eukprot:5007817-Prymnesium_polylepis.1
MVIRARAIVSLHAAAELGGSRADRARRRAAVRRTAAPLLSWLLSGFAARQAAPRELQAVRRGGRAPPRAGGAPARRRQAVPSVSSRVARSERTPTMWRGKPRAWATSFARASKIGKF